MSIQLCLSRFFSQSTLARMDTTHSQIRAANYATTLLISATSGVIFDFECLSGVQEGAKAIELEGIASTELIRRLLGRLCDGNGPSLKTVCTDGHIGNAEMMKDEFLEFNTHPTRARKGGFRGPSCCNLSAKECLENFKEAKHLCGVHAEAIHSFAGMYRIEVQDRQGNTRTIEVTFEVPRYDKKFKKF